MFGPISVTARQPGDVILSLSSTDILGLEKYIGTSFYWSDGLLSYLGAVDGNLYSFAWDWIVVQGQYILDSSTYGRLIMSTDPSLLGAVYQPSTRSLLYPPAP